MRYPSLARIKAPVVSALLAPFVVRHVCADCLVLALVLALLRLAAA